jgi:hypothetical protein
MIKRLLLKLLMLLALAGGFSYIASAQLAAVPGTLTDTTTPWSTNTFVRFRLRNYSGAQSRINPTGDQNIIGFNPLHNGSIIPSLGANNAWTGNERHFGSETFTGAVAVNGPFASAFSGPSPWIDVTSPVYGAKCDGTTDDTSAIQSALTDANTQGGDVFFPPGKTCAVASSSSSALNLDQFHSVGMVCGLPDAKLNSGGGMTNSCVIKFTGTAASLLSARSSFGVSINGLLLEATNALFNGLIVDTSHTGTACGRSPCDTENFSFTNNVIHGESTACAVGLSLDKTIASTVANNVFYGCTVQARGVASSGSYATTTRYLHNQFIGASTVSVFQQNPGDGALLEHNTYEGNNFGIPLVQDVTGVASLGVTLSGNWYGDSITSATFSLITDRGVGWSVTGNAFGLVDANATLVTLVGPIAGNFAYSGNQTCSSTFGTLFAVGSSIKGVDIQETKCSTATYTTFLSGTPLSGIVTDPKGVTTIYGNLVDTGLTTISSLRIGRGSNINSIFYAVGLPLNSAFTSITAGSCQEQTLTLTGITTNGVSTANPESSLGGNFSWSSWISSANTITVHVCAGSTAVPNSVLWNASVID